MQAVCFVAVFFFASGSGVVQGGLFCHGVGVLPGYWFLAVRFVLSSVGFFPGAVVRGCTQLGLFCW